MSEPGSEEKQHRLDAFFGGVLDLLGYDQRARDVFCEVRSGEITKAGGDESRYSADDRVTMLLVRGKVVATAVEIRDDFNFTQVLFAHYVTPEVREELSF